MSQSETEVIFEHTRRLRSHHSDSPFIEAEGRERSGKKEYAVVRKPSRSRRSSNVGRESDGDQTDRLGESDLEVMYCSHCTSTFSGKHAWGNLGRHIRFV